MTSEIEIIPCHPDHIDRVWPIVSPWLEKALTYGPDLFGADDVREKVRKMEMILWLALQGNEILGFSVISISQYPRCKVCDIHWTGGAPHKGRKWLRLMLTAMSEWAKSAGCSKMGGGGRRGWIEMFGFKEHGVMFEMEI